VPSDAAEQLRQLRTELASVRFELSATQQALQQALANGSPQPGKNSGHRQPTWIEQRHLATLEITALIPPDDTFILVDGDEWATGDTVAGRRRIPFLERDGQYWGPPSDDEVAVCNLERLRQAGASFIVFAWPAFWWLDCYQRFNGYLRAQFCCILENERVIVFDLRKTMQMDKHGVYIDEHRHPSDTSLRTGNRASG
jgi:hypothetical protein